MHNNDNNEGFSSTQSSTAENAGQFDAPQPAPCTDLSPSGAFSLDSRPSRFSQPGTSSFFGEGVFCFKSSDLVAINQKLGLDPNIINMIEVYTSRKEAVVWCQSTSDYDMLAAILISRDYDVDYDEMNHRYKISSKNYRDFIEFSGIASMLNCAPSPSSLAPSRSDASAVKENQELALGFNEILFEGASVVDKVLVGKDSLVFVCKDQTMLMNLNIIIQKNFGFVGMQHDESLIFRGDGAKDLMNKINELFRPMGFGI